MIADLLINVVNGIAQNDFRDFLPSYKTFSTFIRPVKNFSPYTAPPPPISHDCRFVDKCCQRHSSKRVLDFLPSFKSSFSTYISTNIQHNCEQRFPCTATPPPPHRKTLYSPHKVPPSVSVTTLRHSLKLF